MLLLCYLTKRATYLDNVISIQFSLPKSLYLVLETVITLFIHLDCKVFKFYFLVHCLKRILIKCIRQITKKLNLIGGLYQKYLSIYKIKYIISKKNVSFDRLFLWFAAFMGKKQSIIILHCSIHVSNIKQYIQYIQECTVVRSLILTYKN